MVISQATAQLLTTATLEANLKVLTTLSLPLTIIIMLTALLTLQHHKELVLLLDTSPASLATEQETQAI